MSTNAIAAPTYRERSNDFYGELRSRAPAIEARYRSLTPRSAALFDRARSVFPGGFTRDAVMRNPYSTFVERGEASWVYDADGRKINDFWFNATSLPLGHAHPVVVRAATAQLAKGTAYFAPTEAELALAELLLKRIPSAERIRFANSGSEAVMMAVRFGRAFTGRPLIVKFEGSYHGSYDDVSWSVSPPVARSGDASAPTPIAETSGLAGSGGRVAVLPFNDTVALERFIATSHSQIAAVLVEPMANRIGLLMPDRQFLETARKLCDKHGIVLIFDEVIAFRVGYHGAQGIAGIRPDLTTLGKIIGGGFPVGAIAGRADILDLSAPDKADRVTHAGTFNANPMVAVAGFATMSELTPAVFEKLSATGAQIRTRLAAICEGLPLQVTGSGSLFKITATDRTIRNYRDAAMTDKVWEATASLALLTEGFLLTPSCSGTVSTVTTQDQIESFLAAFERIIKH